MFTQLPVSVDGSSFGWKTHDSKKLLQDMRTQRDTRLAGCHWPNTPTKTYGGKHDCRKNIHSPRVSLALCFHLRVPFPREWTISQGSIHRSVPVCLGARSDRFGLTAARCMVHGWCSDRRRGPPRSIVGSVHRWGRFGCDAKQQVIFLLPLLAPIFLFGGWTTPGGMLGAPLRSAE